MTYNVFGGRTLDLTPRQRTIILLRGKKTKI